VIVRVAGTCSGPVEITRDGLILRGDSDSAAIQGSPAIGTPVPPIVTARGARDILLENLRISDGAVGLLAADAEVTLEGCDLARTDVALDAKDATVTLVRTTLRAARNGIAARRSHVAVSFGAIRDVSDEGILATELSQVTLFRAEVSSDGLSVESHSALSALHCMLQGSIHVRAYSRLSLSGASGTTATLRGDIHASNSEVFLFQLPLEGTVRVRDAGLLTVIEADLGEVRLEGGSHARMSSAHIAGDLFAEGFSTAQLSSASVSGVLSCRTGADVVCERSEAGSVSACRSCQPATGPGAVP
jgi:hypothetical protein